MLLRYTIIGLCCVIASGCVTSQTENGSDTPVVRQKFDRVEAARTRIALGIKYLQAGDAQQAKYNLDKALGFAPNLVDVHTSFAYYYQSVSENALSEQSYKKALDIEPDNSDTLNNYGVFLCRIDKYEEAKKQFLKAINNPAYIRVEESYENLALCALKFDKFDVAEDYFESALNHNPRRATTLLNMAYLQYAKGSYSKARNYITRYEKASRLSESGLMFAIQLASKSGDQKRVTDYGQLLISLYPGSESTKRFLRQDYHGYADQLQQRYREIYRAQIQPSEDKARKLIKVKKKSTGTEVDTQERLVEQKKVTESAQEQLATKQVDSAIVPKIDASEKTQQAKSPEEVDSTLETAPKPQFYKVILGDTLWRIANRFKVSVDDIRQWNGMDENSKLISGTKLIVSPVTEEKE